jgi:hypothetical protein
VDPLVDRVRLHNAQKFFTAETRALLYREPPAAPLSTSREATGPRRCWRRANRSIARDLLRRSEAPPNWLGFLRLSG